MKRRTKNALSILLFVIAGSCEEKVNIPTEIKVKDGSYTLLIIPDTQKYVYSNTNYDNYLKIFQWAILNKEKYNIRGILQTGDITETNSHEEWDRAKAGYELVEKDIPFVVCLGNHDYDGRGNPKNRDTFVNNYLNLEGDVFNNREYVDGYGYYEEGKLDNYFVVFNTYPQKIIVISLEWQTRNSLITWADSILQKHKDYGSIILTHAHLNLNNRLYDYYAKNMEKGTYKYGPEELDGNTASQLWDKLIKKHANIFLVLGGHFHGTSFLRAQNDANKVVNMMTFNTQHEPNGGNGWVRLLEFWPNNKTVEVYTYSVTLDEIRNDQKNYFWFYR